MVIKVYNYTNTSEAIPIYVEDDRCYYTHNFDGGDTLTFDIQKSYSGYAYILEEVKVECWGNRFIVKKIEEQSDFVVVTCNLDYDDWLENIYIDFRKTNITLPNVLAQILPIGWTIEYGEGIDLTKRTTVEYQEGTPFRAANAKTILTEISSTYGVVFNYNTIDKILYVINTDSFLPSGDFFIEDLNMSDLKFVGDSSSFVTRLYVYGKKDDSTGQYLSIASVNDGKEYIEDFTYSDKIISDSVVDERYTVPEHLKAYGESVLADLCIPKRSYTFEVNNIDGQMYLYKVVTIVDERRGLRVNHQCIKYVEYNDHSLDKVTLSSVMPSIEGITSSVESNRVNTANKIQSIDDSINTISNLVLGTNGPFKWILNSTTGEKVEFLILIDSDSVGTATKLFKLDDSGLHYSSTGYDGTYTTILNSDGLVTAASSTYPDLQGKPQINGVTLVDNKTFSDLGLSPLTTAEIEAILV